MLQEDELCITLLPGPPSALVADCPNELECSTRGLLESLPVKCVDCYGNIAESATFEVRMHWLLPCWAAPVNLQGMQSCMCSIAAWIALLQAFCICCVQVSLGGSALTEEGIAARVSARDSNRITLRKGVATFRNVRIQAQTAGVYKLTLSVSSRKFVVQEAVVLVKVGSVCLMLICFRHIWQLQLSAGCCCGLCVLVNRDNGPSSVHCNQGTSTFRACRAPEEDSLDGELYH